MHFSTLLATVRVALLRSSWRSCFMRAVLFIMRATNSSLVFTFSLWTSLFIHPHRHKSDLYAPTSNSCIFTPIENWTRLYELIYSEHSVLPPPKIFTIPPETPCIYKRCTCTCVYLVRLVMVDSCVRQVYTIQSRIPKFGVKLEIRQTWPYLCYSNCILLDNRLLASSRFLPLDGCV